MSEEYKIDLSKVPLGAWEINGTWHHNPNLNMTYQEQYKHNLDAGHFNRVNPLYLMPALVIREPEESLFKKIINFFRI